jgi:hypothetical protein
MTITTQDCKDFISSITKVIGASDNDKWKRTKKYKESSLVLRDFENQDGRVITIAENGGILSIYQVQPPLVIISNENYDGWGKKYLDHQAKPDDIALFLSECISKDSEILDDFEDLDQLEKIEFKKNLKIAKNPKSWQSWLRGSEGESMSAQDWLNDWGMGDKVECDLHYADDNGNTVYLKPDDVKKVYIYWMPEVGTAYRISVFETKDNHLYLGYNEPD